ncbi:MAG: hypothetical protein ACHQUC_00640 [Chlamydiales bacterium]
MGIKPFRVAFFLPGEKKTTRIIFPILLRYGGYGREAAPLAAQIVEKWREIKQKHAID